MLLLILKSNSPNWPMFLFVQTPFNEAKQLLIIKGVCFQSLLAWDRKEEGLFNAFM